MELSLDGELAYAGRVWSVGFYINRHIAGSLTYAAAPGAGSSRMGAFVVPDVGLVQRILLLGRAARGALARSGQVLVREAGTARCRTSRPTLLEMDGEVSQALDVQVRFVPRALRVCA